MTRDTLHHPLPALRIGACRATPVETRFAHALHAYHGVCPWSSDGTRFVYYGIDAAGLGHVVVRDWREGSDTVVASTPTTDFHTAVWQRWVFNDRAILYLSHGEGGGGVPVIASVDESDQPRLLTGLAGRTVRHVCRDQRHVLAYAPATSDSDSAIERVDLLEGTAERLLTASEAVVALDRHLYCEEGSYDFTHPVANASETRCFFKLMVALPGKGKRFCAFFVMDINGGNLRCFGDRISGHPHWMPDDRHILNIKSPRDGSDNRWLVLVDSETGADRRLVDQPIEGPGHPSPSPDGRWVATDAFTHNGEQCPIYVIDLSSGATREIARLDHRFRGGRPYHPEQVTRGQPHPVWSPDSTELVVNYNRQGERMEMLRLQGFLRR